MRESGIFGSPRRSIIIGAGLFLTGLVAVVIPSLVAMLLFLAGLAIAGIGIAKYGTQQGWWGDLYGRSEPDVSSDEHETSAPNGGREPGGSTVSVNLSEGDTRAMKIAAMVLGILGSIVTFFISVFAVALGGLASAVTGEASYVFIGWLVVLSSILALVGAILVNGNPRLGAILLGIAAVPSILFTFSGVGMFFGLGTLLLMIATVLAFIASRQESHATA